MADKKKKKKKNNGVKGVVAPVKHAFWDFTWLRNIYARLLRHNQRGLMVFLSVLVIVLVIVGTFAFLLVLDIVDSGKIVKGVTIDHRSVGGMTKASATSMVQNQIAAPLNQPVVLNYKDNDYKLDLKSVGLSFDVQGMVDRAYWTGRNEFILGRMVRRLFDRPVRVDVPVMLKYDKAKMQAFVKDIATDLDYAARNASVSMSTGVPQVSSSKNGLKVNQEATVNAVIAALPKNERRVSVVTDVVAPKKTEVGKIIVVKQDEHKLYLYDGESLVDTYPCAVGTAQYLTPNGTFQIEEKKKDPWWYPPKSDWAKDKKPIPPGPGNPLGPYWMDIGNGVGIHSTPDEASIGYSASHGCIRLSEYNGMMLFNAVSVGTPVYVMQK